jgi:hypothetical protein
MLPNGLFVNLLDLDLQQRIANCDDLDTNATEALKLLVQSGPTNIQRGLDDWTIETVNGKHVLFFKGTNYIPQNIELMIQFDNTTGGLDFGPSSKIMSKNAEYVNS